MFLHAASFALAGTFALSVGARPVGGALGASSAVRPGAPAFSAAAAVATAAGGGRGTVASLTWTVLAAAAAALLRPVAAVVAGAVAGAAAKLVAARVRVRGVVVGASGASATGGMGVTSTGSDIHRRLYVAG